MCSCFVLTILGKVEDVLQWVVGCSTLGDLGSVFSVVNMGIVCGNVCQFVSGYARFLESWGKDVWVMHARDGLLSEWSLGLTFVDMFACHYVKFKKIWQGSSYVKPEETFPKWNVPLVPAVPEGQTRRFGAKAVTKEGKAWYKKHTEASYFSDVCIDRDSLALEFPQILRRIRELGMEFIFAEPEECNLHMVWEFYANWAPEARSHYMTVRGRNVPITPTSINDILGTP
ncbi:hypothetical protein KY290_001563 [Solanum tuberosum]|uniref:Putative plant transposon protein domain-containing protein n=1 Tax=Solanum tuberosum TaxID=4113 RepID=A0ABQ7WPV4_SOLTU|nr:hypothetical protein KY290_001563 [Solanum tuberosum]